MPNLLDCRSFFSIVFLTQPNICQHTPAPHPEIYAISILAYVHQSGTAGRIFPENTNIWISRFKYGHSIGATLALRMHKPVYFSANGHISITAYVLILLNNVTLRCYNKYFAFRLCQFVPSHKHTHTHKPPLKTQNWVTFSGFIQFSDTIESLHWYKKICEHLNKVIWRGHAFCQWSRLKDSRTT